MSSALIHRLALVALALCAVGLPAAGQRQPNPERDVSDPRENFDPRDIQDPRESPDPRDIDDPRILEGADLFDALFESGELGRLKEELSTMAWELLPYIDSHCTDWLGLMGKDAPSDADRVAAEALVEKGRVMARLADEGLGSTRFNAYVSRVFSWTPDEQQLARDGHELYRRGVLQYEQAVEEGEAVAALTQLSMAYEHARSVGDTWGQVMALSAKGRVQADLSRNDDALLSMREVLRVGREIRDLDAVWEALSVIYEVSLLRSDLPQAQSALEDQYLLAREVGDDETAERILLQLGQLEVVMDNENIVVLTGTLHNPAVPEPRSEDEPEDR